MNVAGTGGAAGVESSGSSQDIPTTLKNEKRISFYEKLKQMGRRRETSKERKEEQNKDNKDFKAAGNGNHVSNDDDATKEQEQQQHKAAAKLPISSTSQAINVAVKLRESSSRPSEQG